MHLCALNEETYFRKEYQKYQSTTGEKNVHGVTRKVEGKYDLIYLYGKQTTLFLKNKQDHAFQGFQGTIKSKSGDQKRKNQLSCLFIFCVKNPHFG